MYLKVSTNAGDDSIELTQTLGKFIECELADLYR